MKQTYYLKTDALSGFESSDDIEALSVAQAILDAKGGVASVFDPDGFYLGEISASAEKVHESKYHAEPWNEAIKRYGFY